MPFDEIGKSMLYFSPLRKTMRINFTYWQEPDGMWLGYMNDYPDYMTEGYSLEDLKKMLLSLRGDIEEMMRNGELSETTRHSGVLEYA